MIEAVAFDLFGVLAANQPAPAKAALAAALEVEQPPFWQQYWHWRPAYDVAALSDAEYWGNVAGSLGRTLDGDRLDRLCRLDDASWSGENRPVVEFARRLAATGIPLGLLSNIPARLAERLRTVHRWFELFSVAGFSCQLRIAKPDPRAFHWLTDQLAVRPDRILYIDDRAENVRAASAHGLRALHFSTVARLRADWARHTAPA